jgi:hypothetical protein
MPGVKKTSENIEQSDFIEIVEQAGSILASIVPQLFFDLIARLIPGMAIILSLYLALLGNAYIDFRELLCDLSNLMPQNTTFLFCTTFVIFYVISIIFYGLWSFCLHCLEYYGLIKKGSDNFVGVLEASFKFSYRYHFIKLKAPIAGSRITKLKAEIHMSGTLTAVFALCCLISAVGIFTGDLSKMVSVSRLVFFVLGTIGLYFSNNHYTSVLYRNVILYADLLNFKMPAKCTLVDED